MRYEEISFSITDNIFQLGLNGAYLAMGGLLNKKSDPEFEELKQRTEAEIISKYSKNDIKNDRILKGYRDLHEAVSVSNRKNVASPENLIENLLRHGRLPNVNLLVDIYNLVSIQTNLALGAHDLHSVSGDVKLTLTTGNEGYLPLGSEESKTVRPNCYAYIDDVPDVICWLEVRQVEKTKVTIDTTECFYIIQGNLETDNQYLKESTEKLISLTHQFCGGKTRLLYCPW